MKKFGMTRRKFLAGAAVGSASLVASSYMSFDAWAATDTVAEDVKVTPTLCDACGNWCAINVYTKGGRIWKATGNPIAGLNKGKVCVKGHAMLHDVYNKDRIKTPLKRVGANRFEPITWEQAYREIGSKLKDIIARDGVQSVFLVHTLKAMRSSPIAS